MLTMTRGAGRCPAGRAWAVTLGLLAVVAIVGAQQPAAADGEKTLVRLLEEQRGGALTTWGTDRFSLKIELSGNLGVVKDIRVDDVALVRLVLLYADAMSLETGKTVRKQSVLKPVVTREADDGAQIVTIKGQYAIPEIYDGKPLYDLTQRITMRPSGEIAIRYEFEWLSMVKWGSFSPTVLLYWDPVDGRKYAAELEDCVVKDVFNEAAAKEYTPLHPAFKRGPELVALEAATAKGLLSIVPAQPRRAHLSSWGCVALSFPVNVYHRRTEIFAGLKETVEFTISLPVQ